jgi:hypothetical protein
VVLVPILASDTAVAVIALVVVLGFALTVLYSFIRLWARLRNDDVEVSHRFGDAFQRGPIGRRRRRRLFK